MIVLNALAQQLGTILRLQQVRRAVGIGRVVLALPPLVILEPGLGVVNPSPIRPAVDLHLQHAQIQPQLNLPPSIVALDHADGDFVRAIGPVAKDGIDVEGHGLDLHRGLVE